MATITKNQIRANAKKIESAGCSIKKFSPIHWGIYHKNLRWDYWPTTDRWCRYPQKGKAIVGIHGMLDDIRHDQESSQDRKKRERRERKEEGVALLQCEGLKLHWFSDIHACLYSGNRRWDYFPTTGRWKRTGTTTMHNGVHDLIVDINRIKQ